MFAALRFAKLVPSRPRRSRMLLEFSKPFTYFRDVPDLAIPDGESLCQARCSLMLFSTQLNAVHTDYLRGLLGVRINFLLLHKARNLFIKVRKEHFNAAKQSPSFLDNSEPMSS